MTQATALIGWGQVRHTRHRPAHHAFVYPTAFLMLPMRSLQHNGPGALARNRFAALSFYDRDHGDGRSADAGGTAVFSSTAGVGSAGGRRAESEIRTSRARIT